MKRTMQCCGLNGGLFWLSMLLFEYGLLPTLSMLLTLLFGYESGTRQFVWSWLQPALSCTFGAIWVIPLFCLSKIINNLWFQVCLKVFPLSFHLVVIHVLCHHDFGNFWPPPPPCHSTVISGQMPSPPFSYGVIFSKKHCSRSLLGNQAFFYVPTPCWIRCAFFAHLLPHGQSGSRWSNAAGGMRLKVIKNVNA